MNDFSFVPLTDFELTFKSSSLAFSNLISNLKWLNFNIAITQSRGRNWQLIFPSCNSSEC